MEDPKKDFRGFVEPAALFPLTGSNVAAAPLTVKEQVVAWDMRAFGADAWLAKHPQKAHAMACWDIIQDYAMRLIALEMLADRFPDGDLKTCIKKMIYGDFKMMSR